ncbi:MAG TPA: multiheme c-type cytochrome [Bryobacteraceae bacterium]|nr:multiheme c-type cytochrome [Bryobacteraceae bacterium]
MALVVLFPASAVCTTCALCHPKEAAGFAQTPMARSLSIEGAQPEGAFDHPFSQTRFTIRNSENGIIQTWTRKGESESMRFQYVVGSGEHAFGYLAQVGDHLFQSPISYYSKRRQWDVAPGFEQDPAPDFTRPVTAECLACHSGGARPVPETLNTYLSPPFTATGITCERCHGNTEAHLRNPVRGTVLNPAKLPEAARDSICEQCHLAGEIRIPNPGRAIPDFQPGQTLEQSYTVYVAAHGPEDTVKVISQAEQLALSTCKRRSGAKLWCGTCHDPHEQPSQPEDYFRQRCLTCHLAVLPAKHAALPNCIGCHMPQRPAKDGGHTAFTDHRISRHPDQTESTAGAGELVAWREPDPELRDRNLALALVTVGIENHDSAQVIRGYRMLNRLKEVQDDPAVLTALGSILLIAKEPSEASKRFSQALSQRPNYAPYEVNLATALLDNNQRPEAIPHLERALELDPLLQKAILLLTQAYRSEGEETKAAAVMARYRTVMGIRTADHNP